MNGNKRPPPSPDTKKVTKKVGGQDFTADFYPGYARAITVNGEQIYNQKTDGPDPFVLPEPDTKPKKQFKINLASTLGYNVTFTIDDPDHCLGDITLVLRPPATSSGAANGVVSGFQDPSDTVVIFNTPTVCPPSC